MDPFFEALIGEIKKRQPGKDSLNMLKIQLCKEFGKKDIPTDIEVLLNAPRSDFPYLKGLQTKPTRSSSGVAVVAVMTEPRDCPHGRCAMCPGGVKSAFGDVPQSYTGKEPATRRAIRNLYHPVLQVMNRLEQYVVTGHPPEKVELIIMGGTFPAAPPSYQEDFITGCFQAMNLFSKTFYKKGKLDIIRFKEFFELPGDIDDKAREMRLREKVLALSKKSSLEKEQERNEGSAIRCVGLTVETRPDCVTLEEASRLLSYGVTRVELGVQSVYEEALVGIDRGHTVKDSIDATRILKDLGFKINYHIMPGLPGIDPEKDASGLNALFEDPSFRPDMLKIYPTMVLKGTKLHRRWKQGRYVPLTTDKAATIIACFKASVPEYVRIMRVQRDIPTMMTEAGVDRTNLRQYVAELMKKEGITCRCIRCREPKVGETFKSYKIRTIIYEASGGLETFIQAEAKGRILGFVRMRYPDSHLRREITRHSALIRELHVYGAAAPIGGAGDVQHRGIGKSLLGKAEKTAKKAGKKKLIIISGIGVRPGYRKEGPYMVKRV